MTSPVLPQPQFFLGPEKSSGDLMVKSTGWREEGQVNLPGDRIRTQSSHSRLESQGEVYGLKYNKGCNKMRSHSQNGGKEMTHQRRLYPLLRVINPRDGCTKTIGSQNLPPYRAREMAYYCNLPPT